MLKKIVSGVFLILVGVGIIYYNRQLVRLFGRNRWAEDNLGGTEQMYVLGGIFLIFIGFFIVFSVF